MASVMKLVPRDDLKNLDEGHILYLIKLIGSELQVADRYVATVNGLVCSQAGAVMPASTFWSYQAIENMAKPIDIGGGKTGPNPDDKFAGWSFLDVGAYTVE